jgi:hypothetical protein
MRKIMIACAVVAMMLTQTVAQDNNRTVISDAPKQRGGDQGLGTGTWLNTDGMYDTQAGTDNTDEIGFADDVPGTPIDGGLSVLLAAGVVVGARRIRREVNKSKEKNTSREND